jgi:hypothetical protein
VKENLLSFVLYKIQKFRLIHLHWTSLDLAAGAILSQIAINRIPLGKTPIEYPVTIILGLGVFIIASLNRLLDNRKPTKTETKRFLSNQKERIFFLKFIAVALLTAMVTAFFLPENLWKLFLTLTAFTGFSLWLASRLPDKSPLHVVREPLYALVFTASILGSICFHAGEPVAETKYAGILFFLIVFQNFMLASYFDAVEYASASNIVTSLSLPLTKKILHGITCVVLVGGILICLKTEFRYTQRLSVILLSMSVVQSVILLKEEFMIQKRYKGMLITMVLILPFLVL